MAGKTPGREPKGGVRHPVRFPEDHIERYRQQAKAAGLSLSDWLANRVAQAEGLPEPYPAPTPAPALPLEFAAA